MTFLSAAEEFEREGRQQATYGESPDWIRRVLQAYTRTEEYRWRVLLRQAARGSRADVPLGTPISVRSLEQRPMSSVPQVATAAARTQIYEIPATSGGQPAAPNQAILSTQQITTGQAMDLGNILQTAVNVYGQFAEARAIMRGGQQMLVDDEFGVDISRGVARQQMALTPLLPAIPQAILRGGIPAIANFLMGLGLGITADQATELAGFIKSSCKGKRRRRKRLATMSDIKDLAALKSVLGSGKAFDTWIATRRM